MSKEEDRDRHDRCPVCGHQFADNAPATCPTCGLHTSGPDERITDDDDYLWCY